MSYKAITVEQLANVRNETPSFADNPSGRHNKHEAAIAWMMTHPTKSIRSAVLSCPYLTPKMIRVMAVAEEDPKLAASVNALLESVSANPKTVLMKKLAAKITSPEKIAEMEKFLAKI